MREKKSREDRYEESAICVRSTRWPGRIKRFFFRKLPFFDVLKNMESDKDILQSCPSPAPCSFAHKKNIHQNKRGVICCEKPWHIPCKAVKARSEEHTSELQSHVNLVCRLLLA